MEATMTFGQLVTMCENYQYSQEYFDILKESKELSLMSMYIENQRFIKEEAMNYNFTEGYLAEAASEDQLADITKAYTEKAGNFADKMAKAWKNLVQKFFKFLGKFIGIIVNNDTNRKLVADFLDKDFADVTEGQFVEAIKKAKLYTDEDITRVCGALARNEEKVAKNSSIVSAILVDIVKKAWGYDDTDSKTNDCYLNKSQDGADDIDAGNVPGKARFYVKAAVTRKAIKINLNGKKVITARMLLDTYTSIMSVKTNVDQIVKTFKSSATNILNIKVSDGEFKELKDQMEKLNKTLSEVSNDVLYKNIGLVDVKADGYSAAKGVPNSYESVTQLNTLLHEYIATHIKVLNKVAVYRKTTLTALTKIINALGKVKKAD